MGTATNKKFYCAWFCPFAQRAWIALEEKEVAYEYVECTLYAGDASSKIALSLEEKMEGRAFVNRATRLALQQGRRVLVTYIQRAVR